MPPVLAYEDDELNAMLARAGYLTRRQAIELRDPPEAAPAAAPAPARAPAVPPAPAPAPAPGPAPAPAPAPEPAPRRGRRAKRPARSGEPDLPEPGAAPVRSGHRKTARKPPTSPATGPDPAGRPALGSAFIPATVDPPPLRSPHLDGPPHDAPPHDAPPLDGPLLNGPLLDAPHLDAPHLYAPRLDGPPLHVPPLDAPPHDGPLLGRDLPPDATPAPAELPAGTSRRDRTRRRRPGARPVSVPKALILLAAAALAAAPLAWVSVHLTKVVLTALPGGTPAAGPLVFPAPAAAARLPLRTDPIRSTAERQVIAAFRRRFNAAGRVLAGGTSGILRPAGLYGEPGTVDPATGQPGWIMYLGLDDPRGLGVPATTIGQVLTSVLGPDSQVGPWPVRAGGRAGSAQCTVAVLAGTPVAVCGWATQHTVGALVSPLRDNTAGELAALMATMRFDLEHPGQPSP